eukprot:s2_g36.t1
MTQPCKRRPRLWLITIVAFLFGCYFPALFVAAPEQPDHKELSRRQLLPLLGLACLPLAPNSCDAEAIWRSMPAASIQVIQDAYPGRFVAYLTRFLLNFDSDFQELWKATKEGEVSLESLQSKEFQRNARFARFSRTVQLSLSNYPPDKSRRLLEVLLKDYGTTMEAKRQICILFSLLQGPKQQPVAELRTLLRQVECLDCKLVCEVAFAQTRNVSIAQVDIVDRGAFILKEGANVSKVELKLPAPPGIGGISAVLFAQLRPTNGTNGSLGVDSVVVMNKGCGYAKDMSLVPKVVLPADLQMLRAPNLTVQLTRPARLARMREKEAPRDELKSKMTNLLPPFLLPVYNAKLDRLVPDQSLPLTPDPTPPEEGRRLDEVFGSGRQVDRFRADFVFAEFDSTYGPVGISPLERERQLFASDYFRLMASGALAGVVRTESTDDLHTLRTILFLPVQTVKVRMQTNPDLGRRGFIPALKYVATSEPSSNFFRGIDVAVMFSATFGFFSFGIKEYLSRELVIQFPGLNELFAVILASIASVVITLLFATPWEVLLGSPGYGPPWLTVLSDRNKNEGFKLKTGTNKPQKDPAANLPKQGNSTQLKVLLGYPGYGPPWLTLLSERKKNEGFKLKTGTSKPQKDPAANFPKQGISTQLKVWLGSPGYGPPWQTLLSHRKKNEGFKLKTGTNKPQKDPAANPPKQGNSTQLKVLLGYPGYGPPWQTLLSERNKNEGFKLKNWHQQATEGPSCKPSETGKKHPAEGFAWLSRVRTTVANGWEIVCALPPLSLEQTRQGGWLEECDLQTIGRFLPAAAHFLEMTSAKILEGIRPSKVRITQPSGDGSADNESGATAACRRGAAWESGGHMEQF